LRNFGGNLIELVGYIHVLRELAMKRGLCGLRLKRRMEEENGFSKDFEIKTLNMTFVIDLRNCDELIM